MGYCLDVIDLFMSKAEAGRDKDRAFCMALLEHSHVASDQAIAMVSAMPLDEDQQRRLRATIRRWTKVLADAGGKAPSV